MGRIATTDMEVTSIRLERDLKDKLKEIAGDRGYQSLVRDVLWQFVRQQSDRHPPEIGATFPAIAQQDLHCALTGKLIPCRESMLLGMTDAGTLVPLSPNALQDPCKASSVS